MQTEIYLVAPPDMTADALQASVAAAAARNRVAALLVPRGARAARDYEQLVRAVAPAVQAADIAVLIEGEPHLVRSLGADGLHVTGGIGAVRAALEALKPEFIVGAGDVRSRHDAMQKGEAGVDYILFGPLSGPISAADRELARWWAETMEIPGVLSDPEASMDTFDASGCEFIGLSARALEHAR
ncbi:MAG TPA: thiamine phosphate synthase [Alphaproteobacteria bacterium]|nr:thiamine phosphate synthase [Alphaproteobacteria bacterium]